MPVDPYIARVQEVVRRGDGPQVIPVGAQTKNGLIPEGGVQKLDLREHRGIVTYDPSEFLITAKAGTSIAELQQALAEHGQYLPFDPLFISLGATLGGTIASGVSGPDRLLYGSVRDFIMEVAMIDGLGKFVRGGGKVVKNAAGFDTPKMMVGSYGRLGILLEVTLKVFPAPQAWSELNFDCESFEEAIQLSQRILSKPYPIAGLDIDPKNQVIVRLAAPSASLPRAIERLSSDCVPRDNNPNHDQNTPHQNTTMWLEQRLTPDELLTRIAVTPQLLHPLHLFLLDHGLNDFIHVAGGTITWLKLPMTRLRELSERMKSLSLSGLVVRRPNAQQDESNYSPYLGNIEWIPMASRIQKAVDPNHRFVPNTVPFFV